MTRWFAGKGTTLAAQRLWGRKNQKIIWKTGSSIHHCQPILMSPRHRNRTTSNLVESGSSLGCGLSSQPQLLDDFRDSVGLGDELKFTKGCIVGFQCWLRITGSQDHLDLWINEAHTLSQIDSTHTGHDYIAEQQVNIRCPLDYLQRFLTTVCSKYFVAQTAK